MFLQASVILSTGGGSFLGGVLQIFGGGGSSKFSGGGGLFGGGVLPRNTVNVRPVRILLECILVSECNSNVQYGMNSRQIKKLSVQSIKAF